MLFVLRDWSVGLSFCLLLKDVRDVFRPLISHFTERKVLSTSVGICEPQEEVAMDEFFATVMLSPSMRFRISDNASCGKIQSSQRAVLVAHPYHVARIL